MEAGKKAAAGVLKTLASVHGALSATPQTASQIAATLVEDAEAVFHALNHLAANDSRVQKQNRRDSRRPILSCWPDVETYADE
ncbi:MAG: hypothetical protein WDN28_32590 [Chthoniobacter sp.]